MAHVYLLIIIITITSEGLSHIALSLPLLCGSQFPRYTPDCCMYAEIMCSERKEAANIHNLSGSTTFNTTYIANYCALEVNRQCSSTYVTYVLM